MAGAGAGVLLVGGTSAAAAATSKPLAGFGAGTAVWPAGASPDIVVVGAGGWGSFTAMNLQRMGAKVTLVDAYGPGNARSTSGDETRGVRSSYGDRTGIQGEQWMLWARDAMKRWTAFDDEWGKEFRLNLFHVTGDLILRTEWDNFQLRCKVLWDKNKIPYQVLNPDDVRKAFPVISMDDITAVLYEPDAGVVRARRAAQAAAAVFEKFGGKIVIGRATPSKISNGKLDSVALDTGSSLRADTFVWAVGPWMGKTFPELLAKKTRVPIGYVCYFATPVNDQRFTFPNMPSYNFPGVTGWPALPVDNRGFRVRGAERAPTPPGEPVAGAAGAAVGGAAGASVGGASVGGAASGAGANGAAGGGRGGGRGGRGGGGGGGGRVVAGAGAAAGRARAAVVRVLVQVVAVVAVVGADSSKTCRRSSRIRTPATGGSIRRVSTGRGDSSRTVFRCSRTRRSRRRTPATTSRRRAATSSSTSIQTCRTRGSWPAATPRDSRCVRRSATMRPSA